MVKRKDAMDPISVTKPMSFSGTDHAAVVAATNTAVTTVDLPARAA